MVMLIVFCCFSFFFFKQKTAYEMRISDWSSDVCSSDLVQIAIVADRQADVGRHGQRGAVAALAVGVGEGDDGIVRGAGGRRDAGDVFYILHRREIFAVADLRAAADVLLELDVDDADRKSTRLNSSH